MFEKSIFIRINPFICKHKLYNEFGFRAKHSAKHALTILIET